ncbi:MAG: two-component sensor histidine kinase [Lachnospiraceae bacterium]|nr:two-component sensor histidine kinase [Lachnospiraceae bacterium]
MKMPFKRSSLHHRIVGSIFLVVFAVVALCWILNSSLSERFYIHSKTAQIIDTYNILSDVSMDGTLYSEDYYVDFENLCSGRNVSILVIASDGTVLLSSQSEASMIRNQLFNSLLGMKNNSKELASSEHYIVKRQVDAFSNQENIFLVGSLEDGNTILIRSAVDGIRDSVRVSNRFLLFVGLFGVLIAFVVSEIVAGPIADLEQKNAALQHDLVLREQSEKMRKEFLSNVSHELKTPIALIQGYAEGLNEGVSEDPESRAYYCEVILDEAHKMNQMVQQMLTLNQLEFGEEEFSMEHIDLISMIRSVNAVSKILLENEGITLNYVGPEELFVWADPFWVEQVYSNYLNNAIHHCEGEKRIEVVVIEDATSAKIQVFNTGKPIPEESIGRIWEKFYKVDKARTREYGGSGIGLSVVKAIMDGFGKPYGVKNHENGVCFWFELDK